MSRIPFDQRPLQLSIAASGARRRTGSVRPPGKQKPPPISTTRGRFLRQRRQRQDRTRAFLSPTIRRRVSECFGP